MCQGGLKNFKNGFEVEIDLWCSVTRDAWHDVSSVNWPWVSKHTDKNKTWKYSNNSGIIFRYFNIQCIEILLLGLPTVHMNIQYETQSQNMAQKMLQRPLVIFKTCVKETSLPQINISLLTLPELGHSDTNTSKCHQDYRPSWTRHLNGRGPAVNDVFRAFGVAVVNLQKVGWFWVGPECASWPQWVFST